MTREELKMTINKLPRNDAHGELLKDVVNMYDLLDVATNDAERDIFSDKISLTMMDETVDLPLYMTDVLNAFYCMLDEVADYAAGEVVYTSAEVINERVRRSTERMVVDNVFRNHEVMSDDEFDEVRRTIIDIHEARKAEAVANNDLNAIRFYSSYDNRYDFSHTMAERGMLYEMFLEEDDINNWPKPIERPVSILDIDITQRAFYVEYIDKYLRECGYSATSKDYTEAIAIEEYADSCL